MSPLTRRGRFTRVWVRGLPLLAGWLVGCAVGPEYVAPPLPPAAEFSRSGQVPSGAPIADDLNAFWSGLGDPVLERLTQAALANNHDIRMAYANLQQSNALLRQAGFDRWPSVVAGAQMGRERASADQAPGVGRSARDSGNYSAYIGLSWELDLFGRVRRSVEAQRAQTEADAADLASMRVVVVGELVRHYLDMRGQQEQLRLARASAHNLGRAQELLQWRFESGAGSRFDVERGTAELEAVLARIPALEAGVAVAVHRIAVLTGQTPGSVVGELQREQGLAMLSWGPVPVGTPGEVLRRRPDVAAAERRLAAATARVGVATADLFPRFTLGGLMGTQAFDAGALFRRDSEYRQIALGIDGSFLNVGRVRARLAASNAAVDHDLAAHERTVLVALEETENALARSERSEAALQHLWRSAQAGAQAVRLARVRFDNGAVDLLELLDAERTSLASDDALLQGRLQHAQAQVALYRAIAGGWRPAARDEQTP
jgi:outer membrane protein, multidrug efflux system